MYSIYVSEKPKRDISVFWRDTLYWNHGFCQRFGPDVLQQYFLWNISDSFLSVRNLDSTFVFHSYSVAYSALYTIRFRLASTETWRRMVRKNKVRYIQELIATCEHGSICALEYLKQYTIFVIKLLDSKWPLIFTRFRWAFIILL